MRGQADRSRGQEVDVQLSEKQATKLEREVNVISILACGRCCDSVKDMARRGKAFNHCCCKVG